MLLYFLWSTFKSRRGGVWVQHSRLLLGEATVTTSWCNHPQIIIGFPFPFYEVLCTYCRHHLKGYHRLLRSFSACGEISKEGGLTQDVRYPFILVLKLILTVNALLKTNSHAPSTAYCVGYKFWGFSTWENLPFSYMYMYFKRILGCYSMCFSCVWYVYIKKIIITFQRPPEWHNVIG